MQDITINCKCNDKKGYCASSALFTEYPGKKIMLVLTDNGHHSSIILEPDDLRKVVNELDK